MPVTQLPIAPNGFYKAASLPVSAQECVNWYIDVPQAPALSDRVLYGTPGISLVVTAGDTADDLNRGAWVMNGIPYFVQGNTLYEMDSEGVLTDRGNIGSFGQVSMADNGSQLCILIPGGTGYIYTAATTTLSTITDVDFTANGNPQTVTFVDGYFVFTTDEKKFILSAINDGTSYNALDFGSAESSPDGITGAVVHKNQLFIVGESTTEAFTNIGGADFPFLRSGLFLDQGSVSPFSIVSLEDTFMFIGSGRNSAPTVWMFQQNSMVEVATPPIATILQELTLAELQGITSWTYSQRGHYFVGFNLVTTTLVYDLTTGVWHERKTRYETDLGKVYELRCRVQGIVEAYGNLYASDGVDGRIGLLDINTYTEYGEKMIRTVSTQPFANNMSPYYVPRLELTMESGVGNAAEPDPMIIMDRSLDGGKNFQYTRERPIGKIGEYNRRAIWRQLGKVDRFDVYRFSLTDPVKPVIISLTAQIEGGA